MISIDFQGGAHGNFLEFVCNVVADVKVDGEPFNMYGASHSKRYLTQKMFYANHYSFDPVPILHNRVISIKIQTDDLLPLSQISLLRAGDFNINNNELEINTYHKLNNTHYRWVLDILLDSFFKGQVEKSYNAVKDPTWPNISCLSEFETLPSHIRKECIEIHNLQLLHLGPDAPDCPRHILREFFQTGFENPTGHGFIERQKLMQYDSQITVFDFPFDAFYNTEKFLDYIDKIAAWADIEYTKQQEVADLHTLFLAKQPFKDSKNMCDLIVQQLIKQEIVPPKLNLIEEAYINAILKKNGYECRY